MTWAIWIAGCPDAARAAVARATVARCAAGGEIVHLLEPPVHGAVDGDLVDRALLVIARTLVQAGRPVIIEAAGERPGWRTLARMFFESFAEVRVVDDTGGAAPPPAGVAPEMTIRARRGTVARAAAGIAALGCTFPHGTELPADAGWALWITGRPRSGKTTVATAVAARLRDAGRPVAVLDVAELAADITLALTMSPAQRELVTRAVVKAAQLLSGAGIGVIIDGASPWRAGAEFARTTIRRFAELELACPPDVSRTRPPALCWKVVPCHGTPRAMAAPDLGIEYEAPGAPDHTVDTRTLDASATADAVLAVIDGLPGVARVRA